MDRAIAAEKEQMKADGEEIGEVEEDRWYLRRLDEGLYTLQAVDYILAWVCMEDDGVSDLYFLRTCVSGRTLICVLCRYGNMRSRCLNGRIRHSRMS